MTPAQAKLIIHLLIKDGWTDDPDENINNLLHDGETPEEIYERCKIIDSTIIEANALVDETDRIEPNIIETLNGKKQFTIAIGVCSEGVSIEFENIPYRVEYGGILDALKNKIYNIVDREYDIDWDSLDPDLNRVHDRIRNAVKIITGVTNSVVTINCDAFNKAKTKQVALGVIYHQNLHLFE